MFSIYYIVVFFFALSLIGHACYTIWKIKKHLHMMQLNSYFNGRYARWLWLKKRKVFGFREFEPLFSLVGVFFSMPLVVLVLFSFIYLKLFLKRPDFPEKKPFVLTMRATRLLIVSVIFLLALYVGLFAIWWNKGDFWFEVMLGALVFYNVFVPVFVLLANLILMPLEKIIQSFYFRSAKRYLRKLKDLKIIGITGSFGKTTTKYILSEILRQKFNTLKTPGSYNTTMGVTKIIRSELKPIHDVFVVEMSAKKPGDICEVCKLVQPQYGLITAIGEQHLETFKTIENIRKTKNELIESLPESGAAFFNMDDENSKDLSAKAKCRVITFGVENKEVDYLARDITIDENGSSFKVDCKKDGSTEAFQTKLLGIHNVYNILGALAVASEVGMKLSEMVYAIRQAQAVPHRLELKNIGDGVTFIDDAFNSNPVGSKVALDVLEKISGKRKIIITPGMIELGKKEDECNKIFGENIADVCDYAILVGKKQTVALQEGLKERGYSAEKLFIAKDFNEAKKHLDEILQSGDVVLFENDLPDNYDE